MRHFEYRTFVVTTPEINYKIKRWLRDQLGPQKERWDIDLFVDPGRVVMIEFDSSGQQFLFELQFAEKVKFVTDPDELRWYYMQAG